MKRIIVLIISLAVMLSLLTTGASAYYEESSETATATESENYENPFEELYLMLGEHASEIFSALSFVGSLIIVLVYKNGFLPSAHRAISAIKKTSDTTGGEAKRQRELIEGASLAIENALEAARSTLGKLGEDISALNEKLALIAEERGGVDDVKTVLSAELDMLYDLFMSASLPQYEKERVGERMALMKKGLSGDTV